MKSDLAIARVVLATRSAGKLRELRPLFKANGITAIGLDEAGVAASAEEDRLEAFASFEDNALAKARYFHGLVRCPVVADDSGICVVALGGAPGVLSKRWSERPDLSGQALDDENNRLLLERLRSAADRRAYYVCAAAYVDGSRELVRRGEVHGRIVEAPKGTSGFGYDPFFYAEELGLTFGQAADFAKEQVSHRGRAFRALIAELGTRFQA